jgi:hypothetical protein
MGSEMLFRVALLAMARVLGASCSSDRVLAVGCVLGKGQDHEPMASNLL